MLLGNTHLTELALVVSTQYPVLDICGIVDETSARQTRGGVAVVASVEELRDIMNGERLDAAIACHYLIAIEQAFDPKRFLQETSLDQSRLLIPGFLQ